MLAKAAARRPLSLGVLDPILRPAYRLQPMTTLFARASRIRRRFIAAWAYDRA
jgi:hypothetical protein